MSAKPTTKGTNMNTKTRPAGSGNRALYDAMMEKRRSSAASTHDNRPNRVRTRATAKRAAIRNGW